MDSTWNNSNCLQEILKNRPERTYKKEWEQFEKEKANIVSEHVRNLHTLLTSSKKQIRNITSFRKAMIVLFSPESEATTKQIHVTTVDVFGRLKTCSVIKARHSK